MQVHIKGKNSLDLDQKDFLASGGQASIYVKGKTAYKIYTDVKDMIDVAKISELNEMTDPHIIKPLDIILNSKNKPIGYTMDYIPAKYVLAQIFPRGFKEREGVDHKMVLNLVQKLQKLIQHIHTKKILVVDLNELNFLLNDNFTEIYAIDTDSYKTPSFNPTAIMDSIRDRHMKHNEFTELTDWFSFGILAFQAFIGINPYKGLHKTIKNIDDRMLKNISVFNKDVSMPNVCYPLDIIPNAYKLWFKAVFEDGKRIEPPFDLNAVMNVITKIKTITGSNNFDITALFKLQDEITNYVNDYLVTNKGIYKNNKIECSWKGDIVFTDKMNYAVVAKIESNKLNLWCMSTGKTIECDINANELMVYNNRLYVKNIDKVVEIQFLDISNNINVVQRIVSRVVEKASKLFTGLIVENLLGSCYVSVFPEKETCYQIRLKELDSYKILDAKFDNNVLMINATSKGKYDKFIFRFSLDFSEYDLRIVKDITLDTINFVTLANGIVVHLNNEEKIEIFDNKKDSNKIKIIEDPILSSDMTLYKNGMKVMFSKDNELFTLKVK